MNGTISTLVGAELLPQGWTKHFSDNGCPYYLNEITKETQWYDPRLTMVLESIETRHRDIRFAAYRTGLKLRDLQIIFCLSRVRLTEVLSAFHNIEDHIVASDGADGAARPHTLLSGEDVALVLQELFSKSVKASVGLIDVMVSWLLMAFDRHRTGQIPLMWLKIALSSLCVGWYEEKLRYAFAVFDTDMDGEINQAELQSYLAAMAYITEPVDEKHAFAPSELHVLQAVQHCLLGAPAVPGAPKSVPDANTQITLQMFLNWAMGLEGFKGHGEPHTLVWLPTLHRIGATENSKHEKKCAATGMFPILGFRYKCKRTGKNYSQLPVWSGAVQGPFKEYCFQTTAGQDVRGWFARKWKRSIKAEGIPLGHTREQVTAAQTAERSRVPAEGLQIGQLHDESEFAAPGLPQPQVTNWDRPTLLPGSGGASDQQVIEEYTQRARDASGGNDPTAPLFRWAAGIDSHQKQELLAVIDGLHLSNRALQEQLHKAESLALLAQQAATDGMGDGGRANPKSPPDSFSAGSRHTTPERDDVAHLVSMNQKLSLQLAGMEANADRGSSGGGGGGGGTFASGGGRGGAVASKGEEAARSKQAPQYIHADVDNVFTDREVSPPFNSGVGAGVGAGAAGAAGAGAYQHASQSVQSGRMEELVGQVNL